MTTPEPGRHRRAVGGDSIGARRLLTVVAVVCAVLCVPAAAAAVVLATRGPAPDSTAHARHDALHAATTAAHDLLSYDYRSLDTDIARAKGETTGAFAQQYAETAGKLLDQAKQLKAIVQASVKQLPGQAKPTTRIDQSRVQLTMTKVGGRWLVSALSAL